MAAQRSRFWRSIFIIGFLIVGLWGGAVWGHTSDVSSAKDKCQQEADLKAAKAAATASPTPSPSQTIAPSASASASPKASSPSPSTSSSASASASPTPSPSPTHAPLGPCDIPGLIRLGLDLQGGLSVVLTPKAAGAVDKGSLEKAVDIIRQRVDALGVAEPEISQQGSDIVIQLPGIKNQQDALKLIGTTAKLSFRPVQGVLPPNSTEGPNCADQSTYPDDDPAKPVVMCVVEKDATGAETLPEGWQKLALGPVAMQGSDVASADKQLSTSGGGWEVSLKLTSAGSKKFAAVTGKLACNPSGQVTRQLAIVLDKRIESHPQMAEASGGTAGVTCNVGITGGTAQITGNFTEKDAKDLALVLRYGALPVELAPSTTTTVSATLGKQSLKAGLIAGAIGLGIVFLYVLLFYRGLGLIVWIGLAVHASFTLGAVIVLGQTAGFALTLAGIAGLIVSLGIATDSFIVYFERIKDEVHHGKTVRASVDRAWQSAWHTIVAADLVTALAAGVLYFLAVGSVRGFALMLGLATGLDLFVSRLFMHPAVWLLAQTKRFNESKTMGVRSVAGVGAQPTVAGGSK